MEVLHYVLGFVMVLILKKDKKLNVNIATKHLLKRQTT